MQKLWVLFLFNIFLQSSLGCIEMHPKSALQTTVRFYCCKTIYFSCNIWWLTVFVSSLSYQDICCSCSCSKQIYMELFILWPIVHAMVNLWTIFKLWSIVHRLWTIFSYMDNWPYDQLIIWTIRLFIDFFYGQLAIWSIGHVWKTRPLFIWSIGHIWKNWPLIIFMITSLGVQW